MILWYFPLNVAQHYNSPVMNIIAPARRISPLPEIIRAKKEREEERKKRKIKRGERSERNTKTLNEWLMVFTYRLSRPGDATLISTHRIYNAIFFSSSVNDSLRCKVVKADEYLYIPWVNEFTHVSQPRCCHTGVPRLMEYLSFFLERSEKHHLQFSRLEMNL